MKNEVCGKCEMLGDAAPCDEHFIRPTTKSIEATSRAEGYVECPACGLGDTAEKLAKMCGSSHCPMKSSAEGGEPDKLSVEDLFRVMPPNLRDYEKGWNEAIKAVLDRCGKTAGLEEREGLLDEILALTAHTERLEAALRQIVDSYSVRDASPALHMIRVLNIATAALASAALPESEI